MELVRPPRGRSPEGFLTIGILLGYTYRNSKPRNGPKTGQFAQTRRELQNQTSLKVANQFKSLLLLLLLRTVIAIFGWFETKVRRQHETKKS